MLQRNSRKFQYISTRLSHIIRKPWELSLRTTTFKNFRPYWLVEKLDDLKNIGPLLLVIYNAINLYTEAVVQKCSVK